MMHRLLRPGDKLYRRYSVKSTTSTTKTLTESSKNSSTSTLKLKNRIQNNVVEGRCITSLSSSATAVTAATVGSLDKFCNHPVSNTERNNTPHVQKLHATHPLNNNDEFSNNLIPLYDSYKFYHTYHLPSIPNSYHNTLVNKRIRKDVRWLTTSSKNNDNDKKSIQQQKAEQTNVQESESERTHISKASTSIRLSSESNTKVPTEGGEKPVDAAESSSSSTSSAIQDLVERSGVGPTLKRVSKNVEINVGDLLSVYGIIALIAIIIAAPVAVR